MGMLWNAISQSEKTSSVSGNEERQRCFLSCPRAWRVKPLELGRRHGEPEKNGNSISQHRRTFILRFPARQRELLFVAVSNLANYHGSRYLEPECLKFCVDFHRI